MIVPFIFKMGCCQTRDFETENIDPKNTKSRDTTLKYTNDDMKSDVTKDSNLNYEVETLDQEEISGEDAVKYLEYLKESEQ